MIGVMLHWQNSTQLAGASDHLVCAELQLLLDEIEVCLAALGLPTADVAHIVDFTRLPELHLPDLAPPPLPPRNGAGAAGDSGDEGTGMQDGPGSAHPTDDELADDGAQEELGDSTLEAQARGGLCGCRLHCPHSVIATLKLYALQTRCAEAAVCDCGLCVKAGPQCRAVVAAIMSVPMAACRQQAEGWRKGWRPKEAVGP